jgi:hypothetical protein
MAPKTVVSPYRRTIGELPPPFTATPALIIRM